MAEYIVAIDVTQARLPADAHTLANVWPPVVCGKQRRTRHSAMSYCARTKPLERHARCRTTPRAIIFKRLHTIPAKHREHARPQRRAYAHIIPPGPSRPQTPPHAALTHLDTRRTHAQGHARAPPLPVVVVMVVVVVVVAVVAVVAVVVR